MRRLTDKLAFITGMARGQGRAHAVCWLASDESRLVTAQAISIDQGSTQY